VVTRKTNPAHVTLADLARACGFSASTVSIVLNEAPLSRHVATATKELIRAKAAEMGYHPDALARSLSRRRSQTIGVLVYDISDPFCIGLLRGIERTLYDTPFLPIIMDADNRSDQFERYLDLLIGRRVEGLVLVANWIFAEIDPLAKIDKNRIPITVVGGDLTSRAIQSVVVDNEAGGYAAIEHLYQLGHRKIAFVRGPEELVDSARRWAGIQRFAAEVKLHLDPLLIVQMPGLKDANSSFAAGWRYTSELLATTRPFSALLASDDLTALGAIRALSIAGKKVPEDCSVIGFDDIPHAGTSTPGLTTIHQPMLDMGSLAAKLVLEAIGAAEPIATQEKMLHLLQPDLLVRGSTRSLDLAEFAKQLSISSLSV